MNKEDTKQAILGFTEFFKGITGNQDLKIPDDIAKKYGIEAVLDQQPCDDAISRQAVLDKLNRLIEVERLQGTDEMGYGRERVSAYENMIFEINSEYLYPSVTPQPKWIPVSERLPEESVDVLTQYSDYSMSVDFRTASSSGWFWADKEDLPIAWMPLPEPYKAESEDNFGMYKGWAKKRESVYKKLGYAIYAKEEEK